MMRRGVGLSLALLVFGGAAAHPQGVAIDHKAVGCIVVGKYPKMNACFSPAADLARSRVYFRPEGVTSWYYVDMKSDQPCLTGILPRPSKKLVGKHVEYYLEAQNRAFVPSRTAEYAPVVVRSAQECKKNVPVAPFLNNATVAVFPALPAGFVGGGIGTAAVVGIVGAGAAVAGTVAVVASNNNDTTTTTIASSVNTTTTLAPATTTTTTSTTLPPKAGNRAPNAVLKVSPDPPSGLTPLTVTFDMCASSDPDGDPLSFFFDFGDGANASGSCVMSHTYTASAFRGPSAASRGAKAQSTSYTFTGSAVDPFGASQTRTRTVVVDVPAPTTTTSTTSTTTTTLPPSTTSTTTTTTTSSTTTTTTSSTTTTTTTSSTTTTTTTTTLPLFTLTVTKVSLSPATGTVTDDLGRITCGTGCSTASASYVTGTSVTLTATATRGLCSFGEVIEWSGTGAGTCPPGFIFSPTSSCTIPMDANKDVTVTIQCSLGFRAVETRSITAVTQLTGEDALGLVVANGSSVEATAGAPLILTFEARGGSNEVHARLDRSAKSVTWRFEFPDGSDVVPGSIAVLAGNVVLTTPKAIVFRLEGKKGETVAFTFKTN